MKTIIPLSLLVGAAAFLSGCGTVSHVTPAPGASLDVQKYDRAVVRDFTDDVTGKAKAGELQRKEPALPACRTDEDVIRRVTPVQLAQLLASLPAKQPTRISIARLLGEFTVPDCGIQSIAITETGPSRSPKTVDGDHRKR